MSKKIKILLIFLTIICVVAAAVMFFLNTNVPVLNPKGEVAAKQRDILIFSLLLISIVVVPVFILLGVFAWRYRESNKRAAYRPDWGDNKWLEIVWWSVSMVIIAVLSVVTWRTSHELDPYKTLASNTKPLNVQVIALQWKWLFIYPEEKLASINILHVPEDTPINFTITSDAPMNAFWVPSLGSQVYAMSGMSTKLSLNATEPGDYKGASSNISGEHFADMAFTVKAMTMEDFKSWTIRAQENTNSLDEAMYDAISKPGVMKTPEYYILKTPNLYKDVEMKHMMPGHGQKNETHHMHGMGGM